MPVRSLITYLQRVCSIGLLLAAVSGCGAPPPPDGPLMGSIAVRVIWETPEAPRLQSMGIAPQTHPPSVITIRATLSAPDMATIQRSFVADDHAGSIDNVPVGSDRTLLLEGLDTNGILIYRGVATSIIVPPPTDPPMTPVTVTIAPATQVTIHYPTHGSDWNDYVKNDGADPLSATDTACDPATDGPGYGACLHGGELRVVPVPGATDCTGLTAADDLAAFDWICDASGNPPDPVRFYSKGLKEGQGLSDLIDWTAAPPEWLPNAVTVFSGGAPLMRTPASAWWSNPITVANSGGSLAVAGTIFVVTSAGNSGDYTLGADRIALLVAPGVTINGSDTYNFPVQAIAHDFLWMEGTVDAAADNIGIFWNPVRFSVLRRARVQNAANGGIELASGSENVSVSEIELSNHTNIGLYLYNASHVTIRDVQSDKPLGVGVRIDKGSGNRVTNVRGNVSLYQAKNNTIEDVTGFVQVTTSSQNNRVNHVVAAGSGFLVFSSSGNVVLNVTTANTSAIGVNLSTTDHVTLMNVAATASGNHGLNLQNTNYPRVINLATTNNSGSGISFNNVTSGGGYGYFSGRLKVGNNGTADCSFSGTNSTPGLITGCANEAGVSDAVLSTGATVAASYLGKAGSDSVNAQGATATSLFEDITDWFGFESRFRAWGLDGGDFPSTDQRGACSTTGQACRIWDWALANGDTGDLGSPVLKGVLPLPGGNSVVTHYWNVIDQAECDTIDGAVYSGSCTSTFLRNAVEITDGTGNDNLLCESGETCLYTPNIGAYQGHGNLVAAGAIGTGGTLENITLLKYETNGY